jgi:hypothetical protein
MLGGLGMLASALGVGSMSPINGSLKMRAVSGRRSPRRRQSPAPDFISYSMYLRGFRDQADDQRHCLYLFDMSTESLDTVRAVIPHPGNRPGGVGCLRGIECTGDGRHTVYHRFSVLILEFTLKPEESPDFPASFMQSWYICLATPEALDVNEEIND